MAKITTRLSDAASSVNFTNPAPTTGQCEYFWHLLQTLLSAGWTVFASGTGLAGTFSVTPGNVNMQITNTGTGAGGLDRNNAWFVLSCPANKRQFLIQRGTAANNWRMYYSALDTFVGTGFGAISATVPPSATDQQQLLGAAAAYATVTNTASPLGQVFHCVAYSDPVATDVYSFFLWMSDLGTIGARNILWHDGISNAHSLDVDPCLTFWFEGASTEGSFVSTTVGPMGWFKMNMIGETFVSWPVGRFSVNTSGAYAFPAYQSTNSDLGCGPDPNDAAEPACDMMLHRPLVQFAAQNAVKGSLARLRASGTRYRMWPSRQDPSSVEARIAVNGFWFPWLQNTKGRV